MTLDYNRGGNLGRMAVATLGPFQSHLLTHRLAAVPFSGQMLPQPHLQVLGLKSRRSWCPAMWPCLLSSSKRSPGGRKTKVT